MALNLIECVLCSEIGLCCWVLKNCVARGRDGFLTQCQWSRMVTTVGHEAAPLPGDVAVQWMILTVENFNLITIKNERLNQIIVARLEAVS